MAAKKAAAARPKPADDFAARQAALREWSDKRHAEHVAELHKRDKPDNRD